MNDSSFDRLFSALREPDHEIERDTPGQRAMERYRRALAAISAKPIYAVAISLALIFVGAGAAFVPTLLDWATMTRDLGFADAVQRVPFEFNEDGDVKVDVNIDCRYIDHGLLEIRSVDGESKKLIVRKELRPAPIEKSNRCQLKWQTPTPRPLPVDGSRLEVRLEFVLNASLPEEAKVQLASVAAPIVRQFSVSPSGVLLLPADQSLVINPPSYLPPAVGGTRQPLTIYCTRPGWVAVFVRAEDGNRWSKQSVQRVPVNHRLQVDCYFVPGPNLDTPTTFLVAASLFDQEHEPLTDQTDFSSPPPGILQADQKKVVMAALPYLAFDWTDPVSRRGNVEWRLKPNFAPGLYLWFSDDLYYYRRETVDVVSGKLSIEVSEDIKEVVLAPAMGELVQVPRNNLLHRMATARIGNSERITATRKVEIVSPVKDEKCPVTIQVDAKMAPGEGWPVVFVKPPNYPYYAQEPVAAVDDDGSFSATAQLGENDTIAGTRFAVIVVLLKNKAEAEKYSQGKSVYSLPASFGSARVFVSRK